MNLKDIDFYEKVQSQIERLYTEVSLLSKSKADNPINQFKLKFIDEKLKEANTLLVGTFKPFADFDTFDETSLPTNSDVVFILSQYLDCLEGWRSANVMEIDFQWYWKTDGSERIQASPATRFRRNPGQMNERVIPPRIPPSVPTPWLSLPPTEFDSNSSEEIGERVKPPKKSK